MIDLKPVNQLMTASEITQPAPSPRPPTNLRGKQNYMSDLDTTHIQFSNTHEYKFHDQ